MAMREWDLGTIQQGVEVCDLDGETIGTVAHILRDVPGAEGAPVGQDIIEVKTGLLGLGKHYYIPASAIQEVTVAAVVLNRQRVEFARLGWDTKPGRADDAH